MTDKERARAFLGLHAEDAQTCARLQVKLAALMAEVRAEERNEVMSAASLVDASMLAEARAEGRRQGLEDAADVCQEIAHVYEGALVRDEATGDMEPPQSSYYLHRSAAARRCEKVIRAFADKVTP